MLNSPAVPRRLYRTGLGFANGGSGLARVGFTPDRRTVKGEFASDTNMFGASTTLSILAGDIHHPIPRNWPTIATHGRDVGKQLGTALLRLDKAKPLVVIPAA
jgi:hypothetical protein